MQNNWTPLYAEHHLVLSPARKKTCKSLGRGLRHLLMHHSEGWALDGMSTAHEQLKATYATITPRAAGETHKCAICSCVMTRPGIRTADAGQAVEELEIGFINNSVNSMFSRAGLRERRDRTITVISPSALAAHDGGRAIASNFGRTIFWLFKLKKGTDALLAMRYYVAGNLMLTQKKGIPIGGPISAVMLDIGLAEPEGTFTRFRWKKFAARCRLKRPLRTMHCKRPVCRRLLHDQPMVLRRLPFKTVISFDDATVSYVVGTTVAAKLLGFWVVASFEGLRFLPHVGNEGALWAGNLEPYDKQRFPPVFGPARTVTHKS